MKRFAILTAGFVIGHSRTLGRLLDLTQLLRDAPAEHAVKPRSRA